MGLITIVHIFWMIHSGNMRYMWKMKVDKKCFLCMEGNCKRESTGDFQS